MSQKTQDLKRLLKKAPAALRDQVNKTRDLTSMLKINDLFGGPVVGKSIAKQLGPESLESLRTNLSIAKALEDTRAVASIEREIALLTKYL